MRARRKRRAAVGDVGVLKVREEDPDSRAYSGPSIYRLPAYYIVTVAEVDRFGRPTKFWTGAGHTPVTAVEDWWTEPAELYDMPRLTRLLVSKPPGRMIRMGEVKFFLERMRKDWEEPPDEEAGRQRRRRDTRGRPVNESRVISLALAERLRAQHASPIAALYWCRRRDEWRLKRARLGCDEWFPAYSAAELLVMLPAELAIGDERFGLEIERDQDGFRVFYPGVHVEHGGTVPEAMGRLLAHLLGTGLLKRT